jgi:hypothetical protein
MKALLISAALFRAAVLPLAATPSRVCATLIHDVSEPKALKEHGIEPCDPDTLG